MKKFNKIILSTEQIKLITETIANKKNCRLLVFGLGNDSAFWYKLNKSGESIFLEDKEKWMNKITKKIKNTRAFKIDYKSQRKDWKKLIDLSHELNIDLPNEITDKEWNVIIVDAPKGSSDSSPGRMKSIFLASKLISDHGDVFVHDCDREVEDIYSTKFLKKNNLVKEIKSPKGDLRHYKISSFLKKNFSV